MILTLDDLFIGIWLVSVLAIPVLLVACVERGIDSAIKELAVALARVPIFVLAMAALVLTFYFRLPYRFGAFEKLMLAFTALAAARMLYTRHNVDLGRVVVNLGRNYRSRALVFFAFLLFAFVPLAIIFKYPDVRSAASSLVGALFGFVLAAMGASDNRICKKGLWLYGCPIPWKSFKRWQWARADRKALVFKAKWSIWRVLDIPSGSASKVQRLIRASGIKETPFVPFKKA